MTVGERIKELRMRLGMSQVDFADKINVSKQTLYKYENNIITNIPSDKIEASARLGNVSPAELMGWTEPVKAAGAIENVAMAGLNATTRSEKIRSTESEILKEIKKLNDRGKKKLLETAREMVCNPLYNPDYKVEVAAAHERTDIEVTEEMRKHDDDIMTDDSEWE